MGPANEGAPVKQGRKKRWGWGAICTYAINPNKAGGGHYGPPPLHDFSDCSGTHMDGAPPLADFLLSSLAQLLKDFF